MNENSNKTFYAKASKGNSELKFKDLFRDVFKKHTDKDLEQVLSAGLAGNIPNESNMLESWQRPWVFFRFLVIGVAAFFLTSLVRGLNKDYDMITLGATFIIGAVVVPVALVLFFYETNIPRNIPIYKLLGYMVIGGILEAVIARPLYDVFTVMGVSGSGYVGGIIPGIAEEITKLIVVCFIISKVSKCGLNGLLIGAAVGAGFGFFETNGYALSVLLETFVKSGDMNLALDAAEENLILRGICAIDGHVAYTAIYSCALGLVKGKEKLSSKHFINPVFIISLFSSIVIHSVWDMMGEEEFNAMLLESSFGRIIYALFNKYYMFIVVFAVIMYAIIWWLMKLSFKQVAVSAHSAVPAGMVHQPAAVKNEKASAPAAASSAMRIECVSGELTGSTFSPGYAKPLTIGRAPDCSVRFAAETKGISGHHCEVGIDSSGLYVKDLNSSYGTFTAGGEKLQPGLKKALNKGDTFYLASSKCTFKVVE